MAVTCGVIRNLPSECSKIIKWVVAVFHTPFIPPENLLFPYSCWRQEILDQGLRRY